MLNTLELDTLILAGKLDIFNNDKWFDYWTTCRVTVFLYLKKKFKRHLVFKIDYEHMVIFTL